MSGARTYAKEVRKVIAPVRQPDQTPVQTVAPQVAYRRAQVNRDGLRPADFLAMQRTVGNRMAQRMLARRVDSANVQQQNALAEEKPRITVQTKLTVGAPNDVYEQEADRVAGQVMSMPDAATQRPNQTGLPDGLKSGIESLSGISMDNVNVHYNSFQPAQLNTLTYTQGSDIHIAPGQEQHLPHEAWPVVQQAQGRVQPTMQMKDGVPVNDDQGLEHEADVMALNALQLRYPAGGTGRSTAYTATVVQRKGAPAIKKTLVGVSLPHIVQRTLNEKAREKGLRNNLTSEDAKSMLDRVERWPDSAQERLLLNEAKDDVRAPADLTGELGMLYAAWSKLPNTTNYRSFFMMPVDRDQSSVGKELAKSIVQNLIGLIPDANKQSFSLAVTNLTAPAVAAAMPDDLGEAQLAKALQSDIEKTKKSLTAMGTATGQRQSGKAEAEIIEPIVTPRAEELGKLLKDTDPAKDLENLESWKKSLEWAKGIHETKAEAVQQNIDTGGSHEQFQKLLNDRTFWQKAVREREGWVKEAEAAISEKNRKMLTNLGEGAGSLSSRVKVFMKTYSVGEVGETSSAPVTDVPGAVVETKPGNFTKEPPKDPKTMGYTVNIMTLASGDDTTPGKIADQYYKESFDDADFGTEGKKKGIPYRMSMVVGVNLYQSIQTGKAESAVGNYVKGGGVESRYPMAAHGFVWSPAWQNARKQEVPIKDLRNEFDNMNPAEKKVALEYESRSVRSKIQAHIPYGRLRNKVAESTYTKEQVAFLGKHNKVVYIQSGDDDSPSLRPEGIEVGGARGVFSRYDKVLEQLGRHPLLVVGGYRFDLGTAKRQLNKDDPGDFLTYLADVLNQAIRKSLGQGLAVYPTEPNLLIKAFESGEALKLPKDMWGVGAAEGRHMRKNLLETMTDKSPEAVRAAVVFDPRAAVATDPTRFKLGNKIKVPEKHYAMQDKQKYTNFEEMRLARGGRDKKSFIAQILADVVLQNQSMADRRVFAREVGDLLKLQNLNAGKAKILLDSPTNAGQLAESELIAIMIHNNAIQQNIFDLAHISEKSGTEFRDFTERMRFDIDEEEMMDRLHNIAPESEGLPETQKLQPQMAGQVNQIVRLVLDDLKKLKVDGDNFWEKLYETMDKMYNLIPQEKRA